MINKSLLAHSLTRKINKMSGISLRDASVCIDVIFDSITETLSRGERVELRGFGSFFVKETAARKAVFADVPAHGKVVFRPGQKLKLLAWDKVKIKEANNAY